MQWVGSTVPLGRRRRRRRAAVAAGAAVVALLTLSACTSGNNHHDANRSPVADSASPDATTAVPSTSSTPTVPLAAVSVTADGGVRKANPAKPVVVKVVHGTLASVRLANPAGKLVKGALAAGATSWSSAEDLGYAKTYTLTATAKDGEGRQTVKHEKITTVSPNNLTQPYLDDVYGTALDDGATYGVGMVVSVHFDEQIPSKAAATKNLVVTTSPHVDGAWYWADSQTAHWRPQHYYPPGTKVSVQAKVYGQDLGHGLYGQSDVSTHFVIGAKHYSVANAKTHQVKVYFNDKLMRTMPTSMGQGGYVPGKNGAKIALWTMPGIYTVINHENPAHMSSDSYGLPANSPYGYPSEDIYWSTKISTDGIYLHELDTTVWAQGHQNVSHGCLNLNHDNAKWFYQTSRVGDVVQVVHSGGPAIQIWQGGDWSVPWSQWVKGSLS